VKTDCALRDGEPKSDTARLPVTGAIDAVECIENAVECILWNSRTMVADNDEGIGCIAL
jgi:hypothetical protein